MAMVGPIKHAKANDIAKNSIVLNKHLDLK